MATKRQRSPSGDGDELKTLKRQNVYNALTHAGPASIAPNPNLSHADYTIAWICALHLELAASRALFDEEHEPLVAHDGDHNSYVLGRIAKHNVVMAALPGVYGKVNAAAVSTNLKRSFPNIKATLMVGIGGGAPGEADLYLGDVVVGTRVMEYDLGKTTNDGQFECTAIPKLPSSLLLSAVMNLRSKHGMDPWSFRSQELMRTRLPRYPRPAKPDRLFQKSYPHPSGAETCDKCDDSELQPRLRRLTENFWIHYGVVASGDSVNKDACKRDDISRTLQAKCFEMESAGVMDSLECLPIRGICDYSDSHKNKVWQDYAAATAASYARELLETIPSLTSGQVPSIVQDAVTTSSVPSPSFELINKRKRFLDLLDFPQINARKDAIRAQQGKTCCWFLTHPKYLNWTDLNSHGALYSSLLWLRGKAGAGKSTLMKFLYSKAKNRRSGATVVSFFFNARGDYLEKSITGMYRSLLKQILTHLPGLQLILDEIESSFTCDTVCSNLNALKDILKCAVMALGRQCLICFIDALDECNEDDVRDMVQFFDDLTDSATEENIQLRVCFSSRPYPYIQVDEKIVLTLENETGHTKTLAIMFGNVSKLRRNFSPISNARSSRKLQVYSYILTRDQERPEELRRCILWVLCASRPLTPGEFYHAMWAGGLNDGQVDDEIPDAEDNEGNTALATSSSKGLVEVTNAAKKGSTVQFIHESVRDFLIKDRGLQELWPDLGFEWEGPSHESLRICCESYLMHPAVLPIIKQTPPTDISADDNCPTEENSGDSPRITNIKAAPAKMPAFLEYTSQHILDHANKAAPSVPQGEFLTRFFPLLGTEALNRCQPIKIRRYGSSATPIYILAEQGQSNLVRTRLEVESLPSIKYDEALRFKHPLFAAMARGHKDTVAVLLDLPSVNFEGENLMEGIKRISDMRAFKGRTPMSWAAQEGKLKLVEVLARKGESLIQDDPGNYEPMERAAFAGHEAVVRFFFDNGVDLNNNHTAIDYAIEGNHGDLALALLQRLDNWNPIKDEPNCWLHLAARHGHLDVIELLINKGADVDSSYVLGRTVLIVASIFGHEAIVRFLINRGANLTASAGYQGVRGRKKALDTQQPLYNSVNFVQNKIKLRSAGNRSRSGVWPPLLAFVEIAIIPANFISVQVY
ncbi:hypothetical protein PG993_010826 [Apiospora rasikravindrae]|uniref:NACHT domain-containing protein n=1 Tax=Apiospora rasikravindrae TaxID=990691 RepID=A0ABR1SDR0_9PEZI